MHTDVKVNRSSGAPAFSEESSSRESAAERPLNGHYSPNHLVSICLNKKGGNRISFFSAGAFLPVFVCRCLSPITKLTAHISLLCPDQIERKETHSKGWATDALKSRSRA